MAPTRHRRLEPFLLVRPAGSGPRDRLAAPADSRKAALPVVPRGDAPAVAGRDARGAVAAIPDQPVENALPPLGGRPEEDGVRARRIRNALIGSGIAHLLGLVVLSILFARQALRPPPPEPAVQMVFGTAGMQGDNKIEDQTVGGNPATTKAPSAASEPSKTEAEQHEATPPPPPVEVPVPDVTPAIPPPTPEPVPVPELPPLPVARKRSPPTTQTREHSERVPLRLQAPERRQASRSASPLSHPMDSSFAQTVPGPPRPRIGRGGGSHSPVDLSLGPLVKNGKVNTPYATVGIKGVSDDYAEMIGAWIRRHMYYPEDAARRGEDGPSSVHVVLDRQGRVKSIRLVSSSGSYSLDDATQGMFRGARLPDVPPDMEGDHFDIDLTINYVLLR
ncbi:energy transducer TonB [Rhizosaccharibacter radicis]|uniref:Energy transducer TonB n=1 Tax=Rhizosaccharibacter radicis TaxID=2782605 RepID=A0ABT1VWZ4_9PROT|nr:energy transducer TonB [Acetobacteraceae bacterium KSS12]